MFDPLLMARRGDIECLLLPALANRHGLITGATGTGKTITLQTLAENFSRIGVPVFMADVKGDLTGIAQAGSPSPKLAALLAERGLPTPQPLACLVTLWDVFGKAGHPVRATVSDMDPLLLSRMLALNETQGGVLTMVFKIADDRGLLPCSAPCRADHAGADHRRAGAGRTAAAAFGDSLRHSVAAGC